MDDETRRWALPPHPSDDQDAARRAGSPSGRHPVEREPVSPNVRWNPAQWAGTQPGRPPAESLPQAAPPLAQPLAQAPAQPAVSPTGSELPRWAPPASVPQDWRAAPGQPPAPTASVPAGVVRSSPIEARRQTAAGHVAPGQPLPTAGAPITRTSRPPQPSREAQRSLVETWKWRLSVVAAVAFGAFWLLAFGHPVGTAAQTSNDGSAGVQQPAAAAPTADPYFNGNQNNGGFFGGRGNGGGLGGGFQPPVLSGGGS